MRRPLWPGSVRCFAPFWVQLSLVAALLETTAWLGKDTASCYHGVRGERAGLSNINHGRGEKFPTIAQRTQTWRLVHRLTRGPSVRRDAEAVPGGGTRAEARQAGVECVDKGGFCPQEPNMNTYLRRNSLPLE